MNTVVVGLQFGDEGKGKIVDSISSRYDIGVRFQGGPNAGHTVVVKSKKYKFHMLPAAMLNTRYGVIGNGCVVSPEKLIMELEEIFGEDIPRFYVSSRAHLILQVHEYMDALEEDFRGGIGTTKRGIGPSYQDKVGRFGIRFIDLLREDILEKKLEILVKKYKYYNIEIDIRETKKILRSYGEILKDRITDTVSLLNSEIKNGKKIILEGAQGALLDIDFGTYPYVTSSNTTVAAASLGTGIPIKFLTDLLGVVKAYITRVGEGPLPTELEESDAKKIRELGGEYGTTTGRPRRVGWLDLPLLRYAAAINGVEKIAITKIDVLGNFDEIYVCDKYEVEGKFVEYPPEVLEGVRPHYVRFDSWGNILENDDPSEIPELMEYIRFIENQTGLRVTIISYGEERECVKYL